jgi:hypothetical protein
MNAYAVLFKVDSVRRIDHVIDYFGEVSASAVSQRAQVTQHSLMARRYDLDGGSNDTRESGSDAAASERWRRRVIKKLIGGLAALG